MGSEMCIRDRLLRAFSSCMLVLSQLSHGRFRGAERCVWRIVEIEFVITNDTIHERLTIVCSGEWLHSHLINHHRRLMRHGTTTLIDPDSIRVLFDWVHARVLG